VGTLVDVTIAVLRFLLRQCGTARRVRATIASWAIAGSLFGLPLVGPAGVVHAANVVVTSEADSGTGSLRERISAAGADGTVTFDPSMAGKTIVLNSELAINQAVTIENTSGGPITIDGQLTVRVLHVIGGSVKFRGGAQVLILQHGQTSDPSGGGGVRIEPGATLELERVVVQDSKAVGASGADAHSTGEVSGGGGPGRGGGISKSGSLVMRQTTLSRNRAVGGSGGLGWDTGPTGRTVELWQAGGGGGAGLGGGLYNEGTATNLNSTIDNNTSSGGDGGQGNAGGAGGAGIGGGIFHKATSLTATNLTLSANKSVGGNSSYRPDGNIRTPQSTVAPSGGFGEGGGGGNHGGNGGFGGGGGGGSASGLGGNGGFGGGGGGLTLGTAIGTGGTGGGSGGADNVASGAGGGGGGGGGLAGNLFVYAGTATLASSTIASGVTTGGTVTGSTAGPGTGLTGGLWSFAGNGGTLSIGGSVVGGNGGGAHPDVEGALTSAGYSLFQVSAGGTGYGKTDLKDVDPKLGPLQVNGPGPTMTHALLAGSPGIDSGPPLGCIDAGGGLLTNDQRLVTRPLDGNGIGTPVCDRGAYEAALLALQTTASPLVFTENDPTTQIDPSLTLADSDGTGTSVIGATIQITDGYVQGQDALGILVPIGSPISSAGFDTLSGTLTLTGAASPAQYEALLRTVLYINLSHPPSTTNRVVMFSVPDQIYGVATATRQITVKGANKAPSASADTYTTTEPNVLTVPAPGLLANDTDPDAGPAPLTATKVNGPSHGSLSLDASGGFNYAPASGFVGTDAFTYQVSDGQSSSAPATVTIVVNAPTTPIGPSTPNRAPVAVSESYAVLHPNTLTVGAPGVLANDSDPDAGPGPLTAVKVTDPSHGSLDLQANGAFSYRPAPDFTGTDTFTYQARDGESLSAPVAVTITVTATACSPRPKVTTSPTPGGGKLLVRIDATALNTAGVNALQQVRFGTLQNAKVTMAGQSAAAVQTVSSDQAFVFPATTTTVTFTVERSAPGQPTTVPFTIVDGCGEWKSFVGGGAAAGF
jgi:VCBS repeat-containing protein